MSGSELNPIFKNELELGLKVYGYLKSLGIDDIIISPRSLFSILCVLSKFTDEKLTADLLKFLDIEDIHLVDDISKNVNKHLHTEVIGHQASLVIQIQNTKLNNTLEKLLEENYGFKIIKTGCNVVESIDTVTLTSPWNISFKKDDEEDIRRCASRIEIANIMTDEKRKPHLVRRLEHLHCIIVRTSLPGNRLVLTTISPEIDNAQVFQELESKLTLSNLMDWLDNKKMRRTAHRFRFPETSIVTECALGPLFETNRIDLSKIGLGNMPTELLSYLCSLQHTTMFKTNKESISIQSRTSSNFITTECSAPTVSGCNEAIIGKPLLFVIHCRLTGCCLFLGTLKDAF